MQDYAYYLIGAVLCLGLAGLLLQRYVLAWNRLAAQRRKAAKHHEWSKVLEYGERQLGLRKSVNLDMAHDMAQALHKKGRADEALDYALQVQKYLMRQRDPDWQPLHPEDAGELEVFFTASSQYLRSLEVIGHVYLERNQAEPAEQIFRYIAGLGGRKANRNLQLAEACVRLNRGEEAVEALRRVMNTAPGMAYQVKETLPKLLSFTPHDIHLRQFEAEFLRLEGAQDARLKELCYATRDGSITYGELVLYHALAMGTEHETAFQDALSSGMSKLYGRDEVKALVTEYAFAVGDVSARLHAIEAEMQNGADVSMACQGIAQDQSADAEARYRALELLVQTGEVWIAANLLQDMPIEDLSASTLTMRDALIACIRSARLHELRTMLSGKDADQAPEEILLHGKSIKPRQSERFARYAEGEALQDHEVPSMQFSLASDLMITPDGIAESTNVLQQVSTCGTPLASAARLKLARILCDQQELATALEYLSTLGPLVDAAAHARESVLTDAYELALSLEEHAADLSLKLLSEICLIDLGFRDARARRDAMRTQAPSDQDALAVTAVKSPRLPDLNLSGIDVTDMLASFRMSPANQTLTSGEIPSGFVLDGRYQIVGSLGKGGMGTVYRALDQRLKRPVAIKLMNDDGSVMSGGSARFELEAQAAGQLFKHKGVITVLDIVDGPPPFIVMELSEGISLKELVATDDLKPAHIPQILEQVSDVLAYAHDMGILHRDVKPANILVELDPVRVKVADFGLAKLSDESLSLTTDGFIVGTCIYMSPEQIQGEDLDGRSDIYALGITGYELCCGTPPFMTGEVPYQHVHVDPEPLDKRVGNEIPRALIQLIMQCLAKDRNDRPKDCHEICTRLKDILASSPS